MPRVGFVATLMVLALAAGPALATPKSPIGAAAKCYAAGDMLCVVTKLKDAPVDAAQAAEQQRMLAFAAARMDRHDLARKAFAAWIRLDPIKHRLRRENTPPAVHRDWASAWLDVHRDQLDLQPREPATATPLPAPVTAGDLPVLAPPSRSHRDRAGDVTIDIAALTFAPSASIGMRVSLVKRAGPLFWRIEGIGAAVFADETHPIAGVALRPMLPVLTSGRGTLSASLAAGYLMYWHGSTPVDVGTLEPGLTASWRLNKTLAPFIEVGYLAVLDPAPNRVMVEVGVRITSGSTP